LMASNEFLNGQYPDTENKKGPEGLSLPGL
jgi:hypothetical protein